MAAYDFGPPKVDFSLLGNLGNTFDKSREAQAKWDMNANRQKLLSELGGGGNLEAMGRALIKAGDLEGGMQALRLHAANTGTPWQREEAARQAAQFATTQEGQRRRDEDAERARREASERFNRPERVTGVDKYDNPREGIRDPATGTIRWRNSDGTVDVEEGTPGPQSGGPSDPNLPAPNSTLAQATFQPKASSDPGYVIPGSLQGFAPGTVLPPSGSQAAPVPAAPSAPAAPAAASPATAATVASPQLQASGAAVGVPLTATQINKGTSAIPAMSLEEQYQESQRLGMSMKAYRAARAAAIQKELMSRSGGADPEKALGEQSGKIAVGEQYLANAAAMRDEIKQGAVTGLWDRTMAVNGWGRQGEIQRQMESGVDALVHMMTGSGMNESEARRKVGRYEPALTDGPRELLSKHDQLVSEITRYRELAYRGRGAPGALPPAQPKYGSPGVLKFDANGNPVP